MSRWQHSRSSGKPKKTVYGNTLNHYWVAQPLIKNVNRCPHETCRQNKLTDAEFVNHIMMKHPEMKDEYDHGRKFGYEEFKTSAERQQTIDDAEEFGKLLDKRYKTKDKDGKYKHNIFDDLKDMNTNEKGQCKCIQCDKIFKYDSTGVNMCKRCVGEMF